MTSVTFLNGAEESFKGELCALEAYPDFFVIIGEGVEVYVQKTQVRFISETK